MDQKTAEAAIAMLTARRRTSWIILLVVNGLLALGLAGFFLGPELLRSHEPIEIPPPPPDPRTFPFTATTTITLITDPRTIGGINFSGKGFFLAQLPDGSGWRIVDFVESRPVAPAYLEQLLARLTVLPVAAVSPDQYAYTPLEVKITGDEDITVHLSEIPAAPDTTSVFLRLPDTRVYMITAADARVLYPSDQAVLGLPPAPPPPSPPGA